jgi:hypothetical protein
MSIQKEQNRSRVYPIGSLGGNLTCARTLHSQNGISFSKEFLLIRETGDFANMAIYGQEQMFIASDTAFAY